MSQGNEIQANVDEVVQHLTSQIAQLSADNAVLKSLVNQYKQELSNSEQTLDNA